MPSTSLAGVGRADITPPVGVQLMGYHRPGPSTGMLDPLYATALALARDRDRAPCLLLAVDNAGLLVAETDEIKARIAQTLELPPAQLMICFSHTHSGPEATPEELERITTGAILAARQALASLQPATVGWGVGSVAAAVNRRVPTADGPALMGTNPAGSTDPRLGVLRVDDAQGQPLAALLCYGAHGNVLKADSNVISADWPGAARQVVEATLGCPALVVQGAPGNLNARWRGSPEALRRMGLAIGGEALKSWAAIETAPLSELQLRSQAMTLRLCPLPNEAEAERRAADAARQWGVDTSAWLAEVRCRLGAGEREPSLPLPMQALLVNEGALVGIPMEPFVEIGLSVAARFPGRPVFFSGYTNGWIGYLPVPEAYGSGGYEVDWAPVVYGVLSGWITPAHPRMVGEIIATATGLVSQAI